MHGWNDPLDPDRHYRRPDPGDQPGYRRTDEPWHQGEPAGPDDRDPYRSYGHHRYDDGRYDDEPVQRDPYQVSDRDGYDGYAGYAGYDAVPGRSAACPQPDGGEFRSGANFFTVPVGRPPADTDEPTERRRLPRPAVFAGAAAAATLAVMVGVGAFLLPSGSDDTGRPTSADGAVAPTATLPGADAPLLNPSDGATPTPGAPSPAVKPSTAAPTVRKATPGPSRRPAPSRTPAPGPTAPTSPPVSAARNSRSSTWSTRNGPAPAVPR
ncbi:hypothetical protein [Micromonospora zhanjiangensis]